MRSEERAGRQEADALNSSTVLWATGKQNFLIFEGCRTLVGPQCSKRNCIPALTTKAAFDKTLEETWRLLYIFLLSASCLIVALVQFWNSICLFALSRCLPLLQFGQGGLSDDNRVKFVKSWAQELNKRQKVVASVDTAILWGLCF